MIRVLQHMPGYCDFDRYTAEVATVGDLLALPWIARWTKDPAFTRWSISPAYDNIVYLMAELNGGAVWWVVARLDTADAIDLPTWKRGKKEGE